MHGAAADSAYLSGRNAVQVDLVEDGLFTRPKNVAEGEGETKSYTNQKITAVKKLIHMPVSVFATTAAVAAATAVSSH